MMSSCGYWFEIGKAYLVFARQFGDHFVVAACSYTAPLEKSGTAIRLLEKQPQQPDDLLTPAQIQRNSKGRIFGTVRRADGGPLFRADIYVWNESDSSYERPGWPNDEEWRPDKSGDSAAFLLARATSVEKDGLFQSDLLNPGRYRITAVDSSYGPTRWVGAFSIRADDTAPAPVQVTAGRDYRWADIVLHEQKVFALEGIIRSSDGSPLPLKDITIRATMAPGEMFPLLEYFYPDSAGEFILERCPVGRVRLAVSVLQRGGSVWAPATAEVEVNGDTSEVEIVLTRNAGLPAPETQKSQDDERPAPH
jgi:hypothetical protein